MKKKSEKSKKQKAVSEQTETTGTESFGGTSETTGTDFVAEVKKVGRLEIGFPNEDLNKLVGKINEIIEYINNA